MTLHEIVTESRHASCSCSASADQQCSCGPCGVHYSRVVRAEHAGYISLADLGDAIHDDVFSGGDVLLDPEVTR